MLGWAMLLFLDCPPVFHTSGLKLASIVSTDLLECGMFWKILMSYSSCVPGSNSSVPVPPFPPHLSTVLHPPPLFQLWRRPLAVALSSVEGSE